MDNGLLKLTKPLSDVDPEVRKRIEAVFKHGVGHALGLDENNNNLFTIMCQAASGRRVTDVQQSECTGIYNLYK